MHLEILKEVFFSKRKRDHLIHFSVRSLTEFKTAMNIFSLGGPAFSDKEVLTISTLWSVHAYTQHRDKCFVLDKLKACLQLGF